MIVAVAVSVPMRALAPLAPLSATVKSSSFSSRVSWVVATVNCFVRAPPLAPEANVSVPPPAV